MLVISQRGKETVSKDPIRERKHGVLPRVFQVRKGDEIHLFRQVIKATFGPQWEEKEIAICLGGHLYLNHC